MKEIVKGIGIFSAQGDILVLKSFCEKSKPEELFERTEAVYRRKVNDIIICVESANPLVSVSLVDDILHCLLLLLNIPVSEELILENKFIVYSLLSEIVLNGYPVNFDDFRLFLQQIGLYKIDNNPSENTTLYIDKSEQIKVIVRQGRDDSLHTEVILYGELSIHSPPNGPLMEQRAVIELNNFEEFIVQNEGNLFLRRIIDIAEHSLNQVSVKTVHSRQRALFEYLYQPKDFMTAFPFMISYHKIIDKSEHHIIVKSNVAIPIENLTIQVYLFSMCLDNLDSSNSMRLSVSHQFLPNILALSIDKSALNSDHRLDWNISNLAPFAEYKFILTVHNNIIDGNKVCQREHSVHGWNVLRIDTCMENELVSWSCTNWSVNSVFAENVKNKLFRTLTKISQYSIFLNEQFI